MSCQSLAASPNNAAGVKDSVSVISMIMPSTRVVPAAKLNPLPIKRQQTLYYRTITGHICNRSANWGLACLLCFSLFFVSSSTMGLSAEEDDSTVAALIYMEDCGALVLTQNYQTRPKMTLLSKLTGLVYNSGSWLSKSGHMRIIHFTVSDTFI